jgi:hypothetical protein
MKLPMAIPEAAPSTNYATISSFGWDQDSYGADPNFVYVYVMSGVDGVGDIKERVTCDFTKSSFDLKILGLNGKNLRLLKNGLEKNIVPESSKAVVKKNRITIKMMKTKGTCARHARCSRHTRRMRHTRRAPRRPRRRAALHAVHAAHSTTPSSLSRGGRTHSRQHGASSSARAAREPRRVCGCGYDQWMD